MTSCPTCGTPWPGRGKFCGTCGAAIQVEAESHRAGETIVEQQAVVGVEGGEQPGQHGSESAPALNYPASPAAWWVDEAAAAPTAYEPRDDTFVRPAAYEAPVWSGIAPGPAGLGPGGAMRWQPGPDFAPAHAEPASFWQRLGARLIDGLLSTALTFALLFVGVWFFAAVISNSPSVSDYFEETGDIDDAILWAALIALLAAWFLPGFLFRLFGDGGRAGATPGRLAVGTRLVRVDGASERIGYWRNLWRMFCHNLDFLFFLSSLSMLWNNERRTWHDRASGTAVVRTGTGGARSHARLVWSAAGVATAVTAAIVFAAPLVGVQFDEDRSDRTFAAESDPSLFPPRQPNLGDVGSDEDDSTSSDTTTGSSSESDAVSAAGGVDDSNPPEVVAALAMSEDEAESDLAELAAEGLSRYRGISPVYDVPQLALSCSGETSADVRDGDGEYGVFDEQDETFSRGMGSPVVLALHMALVAKLQDDYTVFLVRKADIASNASLDAPKEDCNGSEEFLTLVDLKLGDGSGSDPNEINNRADAAAIAWCQERGSYAVAAPLESRSSTPYGRCLARNVGSQGDSYDASS